MMRDDPELDRLKQCLRAFTNERAQDRAELREFWPA